jgi:hypothetical protein
VGKGRAVDGGGERHGLEAGEHTHAVGYAGIVRMQPIGRRRRETPNFELQRPPADG